MQSGIKNSQRKDDGNKNESSQAGWHPDPTQLPERFGNPDRDAGLRVYLGHAGPIQGLWALELKQLNQLQADTILAMAKALYPHKDLPDAVYALLVKDIDASAQEAAGAELVKAGVEKLNAAAGGDFAKLSLEKQTDILKAMEKEGNPFFRKVRGQGVTSLYDNDMAYKYFGYEGEVFSRGGYLKNGFDDLKWLPDPPVEASPPFAS